MKPCNDCDKYSKNNDFKFCPNCGRFIKKIKYNNIIDATIKSDGNRTEESHPAYAQINFSRVVTNNSSNSTLYGSSIKHQNTIIMKVFKSKKYYDEYTENYFEDGSPLIEVEMSQSQFSEAITSMNMNGVPVTLRRFSGEVIPLCNEYTLNDHINDSVTKKFKKFHATFDEYNKRIDSLLSKKGTLKVSEKAEIRNMIFKIMQDINANIPYLKDCMNESIDKSVSQAKSEIEAFCLNKLIQCNMTTRSVDDIKVFPEQPNMLSDMD